MKTLAIVDGDLRVGGHGHALVTGIHKTIQDLGLALREAFGVDRFHPQWGSLLPEMIGTAGDEFAVQRIQSEVRRIVGNYAIVQSAEFADRQRSGVHQESVKMSEVVADLDSVRVINQGFGRYDVLIILRTLDNQRVSLSTTI